MTKQNASQDSPARNADGSDKDSLEADLQRIPISEWLTAFIGFMLVAFSVGVLIQEITVGDKSPPEISLQVDDIRIRQNGALVEFTAHNTGGLTASAMTVEGTLEKAGETIETSEATIDYLPSHSQRSGGLFFTKNPREFELKLRAKGYQEP